MKELATNLAKGTLMRACRKFSRVGDEGSRFICVVNSSLEGMKATLTAYRSGSSTCLLYTSVVGATTSFAGVLLA